MPSRGTARTLPGGCHLRRVLRAVHRRSGGAGSTAPRSGLRKSVHPRARHADLQPGVARSAVRGPKWVAAGHQRPRQLVQPVRSVLLGREPRRRGADGVRVLLGGPLEPWRGHLPGADAGAGTLFDLCHSAAAGDGVLLCGDSAVQRYPRKGSVAELRQLCDCAAAGEHLPASDEGQRVD
uniref:(northern house mosquito) hypothetical protein n=1 Tax=Culex pipiens TaxID=7175 RepID=A0A8D8FXG5_CULPI